MTSLYTYHTTKAPHRASEAYENENTQTPDPDPPLPPGPPKTAPRPMMPVKDKDSYESKCAGLDRQIDALVYELYGLTADEIKNPETIQP
jgi:type II restriction/modification system DNA methylase subunit YeeA